MQNKLPSYFSVNHQVQYLDHCSISYKTL